VHSKRLQIFGLSNQLLSPAQRAKAMRGFLRNLLPAFAEGRITLLVDRVFPFDELPAARDYVGTNAHLGKVVVRLPLTHSPNCSQLSQVPALANVEPVFRRFVPTWTSDQRCSRERYRIGAA